MTDHAATTANGRAPADPGRLALEFHHGGRLLDPAPAGVQIWQVCITADGEPVGSLRAARSLWWTAVDLRERLTDEGSFLAEVAQQLLDPDGPFTAAFDELVKRPEYMLIFDRCEMVPPWDDALTVAGVVAAAIDRLTDNSFALVFPRHGAQGGGGAQLLEQAGTLLAAVEFTDELLVLDTATGALSDARIRVRDRLIDRARHGGVDREDLNEEHWLENQEYQAPGRAAWAGCDGCSGPGGCPGPWRGSRPRPARDFDWYACADLLFEGHDVSLLDDALAGIEDSDIDQVMGTVDTAPLDWFSPFDADRARDPARGFRHP